MADITKLRGDLAKAENIYGKMPDGAGKSAVEKKIALLKSQIADLEAEAPKAEAPKAEAPKAEPKKKSAPAPKKKSGKETRHVFVKQVDGGKEVRVVMAKSREEAEEAMSGQGFEYDKEITRGRSPKEGFIADVEKGKRGRKKAEKAPAKRASKSERESLAQSAGMTSERAEKESERVTGAKKRGRKPMDKTGYLYEMPLKTQAGKVKRKVIKATSKASADVKAGKNYTFVRELSAGESPKVGVQPVEGYVKPEPKKRGRKPKAQSEVAPRVAKRVSQKSEAIGEGVAIADKEWKDHKAGFKFWDERLEKLGGKDLPELRDIDLRYAIIGLQQDIEIAIEKAQETEGNLKRAQENLQKTIKFFMRNVKSSDAKKMARGGNTLGSLAEGVNAFAMFAMNFPTDWVRDAFDGNAHLINKFNSLYDRVGSDAVVLKFYTQLDGGNKKTMENYIANWSKKSMARGGSVVEWANDENEKLGKWLMSNGVGKAILRSSTSASDLEAKIMSRGKSRGEVAGLEYDNEDEGLQWVAFSDLWNELKSRGVVKMARGGTTDDKPKVESLTEVFFLMDGTEIDYEDMDDAEKMFGGDPLTPQELVDKLAVDHDIYVMDVAPELFDLPDGDDEDDDEFYTGDVKDGVTIDDIEDAIEDQLEADNSYNYSAPFVFDVRFTKTRDAYDPQIMLVREHRGGDVRGNYGDYKAFSIDADTNPFYGNISLNIETDKGSISLTAESLESYNFYVNSDETGTFEEDGVISRDEIEEALDFGEVKSETLYIND